MNTRIFVLNCPVDSYSGEDALKVAQKAIDANKNLHIITINPEMVMYAQDHSDFMNIIKNSDLNIIDGVGIKLALKIQNIKANQIRGVDFSRSLIELANNNNYTVGFLGAKEEVIKKAQENFQTQYPSLNIVYSRNGYFSSDDEIIEEIVKKKPQIMLVGLGSPKQEEFIVKLKQKLTGTVFVGVGGSFDVFSGIVKEAPEIYRKLGIEWLYRTLGDPKRFKRIFPTLPLFLIKCIIEEMQKKD